ncbi:hypothetical protein BD310DRAFT_127993 [Dichomitus squalens]|uniref:Uncharacterized protein n=1 Tax=Dichomitus squalens TaxID=114155 RepID=A0A4Q9PFS0_9APHY|nr:hypothetical protein BD310DRAFT_127993 [Dichomitus squalens]
MGRNVLGFRARGLQGAQELLFSNFQDRKLAYIYLLRYVEQGQDLARSFLQVLIICSTVMLSVEQWAVDKGTPHVCDAAVHAIPKLYQ